MIKMFIGNEEVVSNHEFSIKEEMLSASSTILNNCYPKSWELTKDYVSNFYYPKDYSKFVLASGEFEHGDTEYSILQAIGKNLFDKTTDIVNNYYITNTGGIAQDSTLFYQDKFIKVEPNTQYTISSNANRIYRIAEYSSTQTFIRRTYNQNASTKFTITTTADTEYIKMAGSPKVAIDSLQFELGSNATSYVGYGQDISYETNVGKEWNTFNIYGSTIQETRSGDNLFTFNGLSGSTGVSVTYSYNNSIIKLNGTTSGAGNIVSNVNTSVTLPAGNYTCFCYKLSGSYTIPTGSGQDTAIYLRDTNNTQIINMTLQNQTFPVRRTFTLSEAKTIKLQVYANSASQQYSNLELGFQILSGTITSSDFEQYGVMPSPDYPSKLISVGYDNLFEPTLQTDGGNISLSHGTGVINGDTFTFTATGADLYFGQVVNSGSSWARWAGILMNITGKKPIYYYVSNPLFTKNYMVWYNESKVSLGYVTLTTSEGILTPPNNAKYVSFRLGYANSVNGEVYSTKVMITEMQEACQYVPYGKYGIEVRIIGKNLFNKNDVIEGKYIDASGNFINQNGNFIGNFIKIDSNLSYYISANSADAKRIAYYDDKYAFISRQLIVSTSGTLTIPSNAIYLRISSYDVTLSSLQLEQNNTKTEYEEYKANTNYYILDEPLRSAGTTKDRLYIQNGILCVERNIGKVVFDGTETWELYATISGYSRFDTTVATMKNTDGINIDMISNKFVVVSSSSSPTDKEYIQHFEDGLVEIQIARSRFGGGTPTADDFKTWLSSNNVELYYVLATPYTEEVGKANMPRSFVGENNILVDTGVNIASIDVYYYWKNYDVIFAGIVKNSGDISLNPRHPHYCSLQILDYKTFLSESDTLDYVISNKTIKEAIEMVVDTVSSYGFSVGTIDISSANDVIGAYSTLNKTAYDVLQYLADISGSRWRARYIDNSSMAIDFYEPDTLPQAEDIEYTQEYWEDNNIVDLTFNYGTRDYRNKQIVLSDEVYAGIDYNEIILSNGYNTNFITSQNVGIVKEITVNGVRKDVISQQERELGADADFYYTPGKNIIESSSSYTAGTQIAVTYTPLVKGRQIVFNNDEVGRIATQTDTIGVISRYESRNDVVSSAELERIGETYIEYKGKAEVILTLTTHNKDLFNIGEVVYFNSPIDELKQKYMVKSKETQYIIESETGTINLFYVYELTSSFNSEKAINYFDNQRNKAQGNIQEGESITRNIDINSSAVIIWGNSSITETTISVVGDNVLNSVLNSPFIE